ncbi:MAG: type II secretion system F family protein, partial [Janthinobacterium lividum]
LKQIARMYGVEQLLTIGAVLGVSTRFGGRSDQILTRISDFMRDVEQAHEELLALSSETRISAWVLGLLPLALVCGLMIFNNRFFSQMWHDPMGAQMLIGAAGLQVTGSFLLYRLAKSV